MPRALPVLLFFVIAGVFDPNADVYYPRSDVLLFVTWEDFGKKAAC